MPPSLAVSILFLRAYDSVSFVEAIERTKYDLRWKVRSQCVSGQGPRSINIQHEERLQQLARRHNQTEAGKKTLRERVVVEHGIARLVRRGIRQSRYFGKTKTRFQVILAAVVANLSLVVGFCRHKLKLAMNTAVDPVPQALTDASTRQNASPADSWILSIIRFAYSLLQIALMVPNPDHLDFFHLEFFPSRNRGFWTDF